MWALGMYAGWIVGGVIIVLLLLCQTFYSVCRWVNDEKQKMVFANKFYDKHLFGNQDVVGNLFVTFLVVFVTFLVVPLVWPIAIFAALVFLALYSLRGFICFKKKVNKVLKVKQGKKS